MLEIYSKKHPTEAWTLTCPYVDRLGKSGDTNELLDEVTCEIGDFRPDLESGVGPLHPEMLNGVAFVNTQAYCWRSRTVGIGQGALQSITGGDFDHDYVVTWTAITTSDPPQTLVEQQKLMIRRYVPSE